MYGELDLKLPADEDNSTINFSHQSFSIQALYDPVQRSVRSCLMIVMSIISLTLNILLYRQTKARRVRTDSTGNQTIIQHLSIANCITAVLCLLTKGIWDIVIEWYLRDTMCKVVSGLEKFALYANTYLVVILSLHRVINFKCADDSISVMKKRSKFLIFGAWSFSGICAIPQAFGHSMQQDTLTNSTVCLFDLEYYGDYSLWANHLEAYMHVVLLYLVPVFMIITSSTILLGAILKRMKRFGLREDEFGEKRPVGATSSIMSPLPNNSSSSAACNNEAEAFGFKRRGRSDPHTEVVTVTHYLYPDRLHRVNFSPPQCTIAQPTLCSNPILIKYRNGQAVSFTSGSAISGAEVNELAAIGMLRSHTSLSSPSTFQPAHTVVDGTRATVLFQRAKLRSIQVAATTVGCYVLCWSPYYVFQLLILSLPESSYVDSNVWDTAAWLYVVGLAYIIVHPLLYGTVKIRHIRRRLRKICIKSKRRNTMLNM